MREIRSLVLILGDQLNMDSLIFQGIDAENDCICMAEVSAESTNPLSSKQRTVLFLSAMRHFAWDIWSQEYDLIYLPITLKLKTFTDALRTALKEVTPQQLKCVIPGDYRIMCEINAYCEEIGIPIEWIADDHFIANPGEFREWLSGYKQPRMEYWYRHLRKTRNILMDKNGKPEGGSWNYDKQNRKAFPKTGPVDLPDVPTFTPDSTTQQVIADVDALLPDLPGSIEHFNWPVTRDEALEVLDHFINERLTLFGDFQDAMWTDQPTLYHSMISSSLNLKLLSPAEVIERAEEAYREQGAPLNAVEGFIRQVLGWREYVRALYWHHRKDWMSFNSLRAERALPSFYWDGDTQMTCMRQSIEQVLILGYGHHIQRLMVTGLFALLYGVKPSEVHNWYLAMYTDAIAWVEVPNTLGMSQFADGGIVGSKPYIASGNYIHKMSNYCDHCPYNPKLGHGEHACPFTTLYWAFIDRNQQWLAEHPRLSMQVSHWLNKPESDRIAIIDKAEEIYASGASF